MKTREINHPFGSLFGALSFLMLALMVISAALSGFFSILAGLPCLFAVGLFLSVVAWAVLWG